VFEVESETGQTYILYAAYTAGGLWLVYLSVDVGCALVRWTLGDRFGQGMTMDSSLMAYCTRHGLPDRKSLLV
jgi:hypothetical protein